MAVVTLEEIHEDLLSIKKDMTKIKLYFEEDDLLLSEEIKKQITISRKTPIFRMISQDEVEMEFLGIMKEHEYGFRSVSVIIVFYVTYIITLEKSL
jgi:hypothetical protein